MIEKEIADIYSTEEIAKIKSELMEALQHYQRALKISTPDRYPKSYALVHNNLGLAYVKLAYFTNDKNDILRAIDAYKEALKIRTADEYPIKYFLLQKALGDAYYQLSFKENREENHSKAFDAYQRFLEIESYTNECKDIKQMCQEVKDKMERIKIERGKDAI